MADLAHASTAMMVVSVGVHRLVPKVLRAEEFCQCCVFEEDTVSGESCSVRDDVSGEVAVLASTSPNWLGNAGFLKEDNIVGEFFPIGGDRRSPSASSSGHTG